MKNHRIQTLALNWTGHVTYIQMNSHIWLWSPSTRVAIDWRWNWQTVRTKKKWTRTPGYFSVAPGCTAGTKGFRETWFMSVVRLKNSMKIWQTTQPTNVLESNSLVKLATSICSDQSPWNWRAKPKELGTNPPGWSRQWCHVDVTISIMCYFPLRKWIILWTLE